jgi:hypothetical protein
VNLFLFWEEEEQMKRCRVEVVRDNNGRSKWGLQGFFLKKILFLDTERFLVGTKDLRTVAALQKNVTLVIHSNYVVCRRDFFKEK